MATPSHNIASPDSQEAIALGVLNMPTITRRNVLRGGGAVVLGAGIAASGGAIAARQLTAKEAAAEFVDAYRLLFSRLQMLEIPPRIGCFIMATAVTVEVIDAFAHDDVERNPDANVVRLTEGAWPSWPGRVSS